MSTDLDPALWISQSEAARLRSVSRQAIANLIKKERFRTLSIAGKILVHREDVEAYQHKSPGPEPKVGHPSKSGKKTATTKVAKKKAKVVKK
jgi:hypothetical protein